MFFQSLEFYVIAVIAAAAVIGIAARPARRGEARTWLLPAIIRRADDRCAPAIIITCDDHCDLTITRVGLTDVDAVNFSVTLIGRDISIEEHIITSTHDTSSGEIEAETKLTFTGPENYHISYSSPELSLFAALQFTVRPGVNIRKELILS